MTLAGVYLSETKLHHCGWRSVSRELKMEPVKPTVSEAIMETGLFLSED